MAEFAENVSSAAISPTLASLIGPEDATRFLREGFGRDAWRTRLEPEQAATLFDWARLNGALAEHRLGPPRLRLERGGAEVLHSAWRRRSGSEIDPAGLMRQLRDGATLILDAAQEISPPLRRLCAGLSADFTCFCAANLYASWGATQGFDVHWDDHDVFVVQAEGRKRWALYGQTRASPVVRADPTDHLALSEPLSETVLQAGDLLYLPRGYWHAAVGVGEPSLHLTVGLTRRTGSEFLHWLAEHLLSKASVRADLPFEQGDAAVGQRLGELLSDLRGCDPRVLAELYRREVEAALPQGPELSFPALGGTETPLNRADQLRLASGGVRIERTSDGDSVVLSWRGTHFTVSALLQEPLEALVRGEFVPYAAFGQRASARQAASFVRDMIGRGIFVLTPDPS